MHIHTSVYQATAATSPNERLPLTTAGTHTSFIHIHVPARTERRLQHLLTSACRPPRRVTTHTNIYIQTHTYPLIPNDDFLVATCPTYGSLICLQVMRPKFPLKSPQHALISKFNWQFIPTFRTHIINRSLGNSQSVESKSCVFSVSSVM